MVRAICTPFCNMLVKAAIMFADITASVPVMIWFDGNAVVASFCVPAWNCMVCKVDWAADASGPVKTGPKPSVYSLKGFLVVPKSLLN